MSLEEKIEELRRRISEISSLIEDVQRRISERNADLMNRLYDLLSQVYPDINIQDLDLFLRRPYAIVQRRPGEWLLIVPKFVTNMNLGHLVEETPSYRIFLVNRWVGWLYDLPKQVMDELGLDKPVFEKVYLEDNRLIVPREMLDEVWVRYRGSFVRRAGDGEIVVKRDKIPELMLQLVRDGIIPYKMRPIPKDLILERDCDIELRDYQREAYELFLKYGSIGLFWPPGAGKTYVSLYAMTKLKGRKLIIVPSLTLAEQWREKIRKLTPISEDEYEVITYNLVNYPSFKGIMKEEWSLIIFDETHHIAADTFIKLAWLKSVGRIALSASPYREDGREDIIFALSGYFTGIDWNRFKSAGLIKPPKIDLYIVEDLNDKLRLIDKLVSEKPRKILIFTDSIDFGEKVSRRLGIPFIHGSTKRRLEIIEDNDVVAISRVGDEGIDIPSIRTILEATFLYGSRRQAIQRLGRILHSRYRGYYAILMTKEEYQLYRKRLYSILEKGFTINQPLDYRWSE